MKQSEIDKNKNEDAMRLLLSKTRQLRDKVHLGGGKKKIARQHEKG